MIYQRMNIFDIQQQLISDRNEGTHARAAIRRAANPRAGRSPSACRSVATRLDDAHRRPCDIALNRAITGRNPGNRIPICVPIGPSPPECGRAGANRQAEPARPDENRDTVRPLATALDYP